jgi:hypothetical protein
MAAPAGNDRFLTDLDIRIWLRDNDPDANTLLDDYEFTPEELRTCQTLAADYWNEMPPYIGSMDYTRSPFRFHMLMGTVANLLFAAAHRFRRNALQYTAGGLNVADQEKYTQYDAAGQRMWDMFKTWVAVNKRALNAERGYGIIG